MKATAKCKLLVQDGKVWCEFHHCAHPTSWEWEKHVKCNPNLPTHYENGKLINPNDLQSRIDPVPLPFRHVLYTGYLCHCGTILLDAEQ